jgi:dTDP-4-dehydrorhamnose reductase
VRVKLFVTGGNGRMGRELIPQLTSRGWTITAPRSSDLDITDESAVADVLEHTQPDVVLHLAAYTDVAKAEREREQCWAVNVTGTRNIARHASGRFVHFSTDYVFDGERGLYTESDAPNPSNYYSLTKTVAEEAARSAKNALIVRTTFKDAVWRYPVAFDDQFTSADFTDVIGQEILTLMLNLERVQDDVLHVVTERKSVYELAHRRNPGVQPGSRLSANVHIPPDVSLDNSRWHALKAGFELGTEVKGER